MAIGNAIRSLLAGSAAVLALGMAGCTLYPSAPSDPAYDTDVRPIFLAHCTRCHGNGPNGGSINIPPGASSQGYPPVGCYTQFGVNKSVSPDGGVCYYGAFTYRNDIDTYVHSADPINEMPPPPAARLNSHELAVIDAWVAELPIPTCSNSSHPDPALFCPDGGT